MQTFYPVFESGQVLTNAHLNQLTTWLNEQQLATRRKLYGVGIVCGLEVSLNDQALQVSRGVAVSSAGYLLHQPEDESYTSYRPYNLPVSEQVEDSSDIDAIEAQRLLPLDNLTLYELVTEEYSPAPGEPNATDLNHGFLSDKVVMLLLEAQQQSLKNCDINDCADKGARQQFVLRTLLISEEQAKALWQHETSAMPYLTPGDLDWQAMRMQLQPLAMQKLIAGRGPLSSLTEIRDQAAELVNDAWRNIQAHLKASFDTWAYLLRDRFPVNAFANDPWQDVNPSLPGQAQNAVELIVHLHRYDLMTDVIAAFNEFLNEACEFEGICCPNPQRFVFHVLLGKPVVNSQAEAPGNRLYSQIDFGAGAQLPSAKLRHPFYPSMQINQQYQHAGKMLDLYYRCWLLLQRFRDDNLIDKSPRIMPSRENGTLSQKAIPYYYAMQRLDDLHRNWHPSATRCGMLNQVHGYSISPDNPHPLKLVPKDHDFYRIEGILGKPLGAVMAELTIQQRELGLSFGIEPVFLPVEQITSDAQRADYLALLLRDQTLLRLFKCRISDMDMIFLVVMAVLFQLLLALLYLAARVGGQRQGEANADAFSMDNARYSAFMRGNQAEMSLQDTSAGSETAEFFRKQVQGKQIEAKDILIALDEEDDRNGYNAEIYIEARKKSDGDLRSRVRDVMGSDVSKEHFERTYQSARLMEKAEHMMTQTATDTIAKFDFDRFGNDLKELDDAYQGARNTSSDSTAGMALQNSLDSNIGMLNNLSKSSLLSNLRGEFTARITAIFEQFLFDGYAERHPGLEHCGGVRKGGTLVLAYTHQALLSKYAPTPEKGSSSEANTSLKSANTNAFINASRTDVLTRSASFGSNTRGMFNSDELQSLVSANRTDRVVLSRVVAGMDLTGRPSTSPSVTKAPSLADVAGLNVDIVNDDDPINNMVVVADFCLPIYCCDSDCSDFAFAATGEDDEPGKPPSKEKIRVSGTIVSATGKGDQLRRIKQPIPILDATLEIRDRDNVEVNVKMVRGSFHFAVEPGEYQLRASAKGYESRVESIKISAPLGRDAVITLNPSSKGDANLNKSAER